MGIKDGKKKAAARRKMMKWQRLGPLWGLKVKLIEKPTPANDKTANQPKEVQPKPRVGGRKKIRNVFGIPCVSWNEPKAPAQPRKTFSGADAFGLHLLRRGFVKLGSGAYSTVYAKPGQKRVIKVTRYQDNWIDYVLWAAKHGYAGNFAPQVYSWKKFKYAKVEDAYNWRNNDNTEWSVSVVERMKETLNGESKQVQDMKIIEYLHYPASRGNVLAQLYCDDVAPGVAKFITDLHKEFHASDVYAKNMMIREDGTFCVTDPVCGQSSVDKRRLKTGDFSPVVRRYLIACSY